MQNNSLSDTISVVMPIFNGSSTIEKSINSVKSQTFSNWELICVDDCSTDNSYDLLDCFAKSDSRIRVFRSNQNRGPAAARNLAISMATGNTITYLDCDDEYYNDFLYNVHSNKHKSQILVFNNDSIYDKKFASSSEIDSWDPSTFYRYWFLSCLPVTLGVAHDRSLWSRVGGFDEALWTAEDWDFWKRLARLGSDILFVPLRSGVYRRREGSRSYSPRVTKTQRDLYEYNLSNFNFMYGEKSKFKITEKIIYATSSNYFSSANSFDSIRILETLANSGLSCQAFCGPDPGENKDVEFHNLLKEMGLPFKTSNSFCGPHAARITYTVSNKVPISMINPVSLTIDNFYEYNHECLFFFYEKFLDSFSPDVLIANYNDFFYDSFVRLAKSRDIAVVVPLHDASAISIGKFFYTDCCIVDSADLRKQLWEKFGLFCMILPPLKGTDFNSPEYAEFFRSIQPQPGPPYVPVETQTANFLPPNSSF